MVRKVVREMESSVKIPGDVKDRIVREAHKRIETFRAQGILSQQVLAEIRTWLTAQEEIEEVRMFHETDLTVRFADGTQIGILLGREQAYGPFGEPQGLKGGDRGQKLE